MTYGFNAQADVRAVNLSYENGAAYFDVRCAMAGDYRCTLQCR